MKKIPDVGDYCRIKDKEGERIGRVVAVKKDGEKFLITYWYDAFSGYVTTERSKKEITFIEKPIGVNIGMAVCIDKKPVNNDKPIKQNECYFYLVCCDRELYQPMIFNSLDAARDEMLKDLNNIIEERYDDLKNHSKTKYDDNDRIIYAETDEEGISELSAWANNCGLSHCDWDASIIPASSVKNIDLLFKKQK